MNKKFGKLANGSIIPAPDTLYYDGYYRLNPSEEVLLAAGQKEIVYNAKPEATVKGAYIAKYVETDTQIVQEWTFVPYEEAELHKQYQNRSVLNIRENYSVNDELKIMREYLANPNNAEAKAAFESYNAFVEKSKGRARSAVYDD